MRPIPTVTATGMGPTAADGHHDRHVWVRVHPGRGAGVQYDRAASHSHFFAYQIDILFLAGEELPAGTDVEFLHVGREDLRGVTVGVYDPEYSASIHPNRRFNPETADAVSGH